MKYPHKVKRNYIQLWSQLIHSFFGGWTVRYRDIDGITYGSLDLPDDWQDMDRTWTSQDIYWEDKYDCITMQGGALQYNYA